MKIAIDIHQRPRFDNDDEIARFIGLAESALLPACLPACLVVYTLHGDAPQSNIKTKKGKEKKRKATYLRTGLAGLDCFFYIHPSHPMPSHPTSVPMCLTP